MTWMRFIGADWTRADSAGPLGGVLSPARRRWEETRAAGARAARSARGTNREIHSRRGSPASVAGSLSALADIGDSALQGFLPDGADDHVLAEDVGRRAV